MHFSCQTTVAAAAAATAAMRLAYKLEVVKIIAIFLWRNPHTKKVKAAQLRFFVAFFIFCHDYHDSNCSIFKQAHYKHRLQPAGCAANQLNALKAISMFDANIFRECLDAVAAADRCAQASGTNWSIRLEIMMGT